MGIVKVYATSCEKDGKNFFTVPAFMQDRVRAQIEADGFDILEDGTVVKHVEPQPEPKPEPDPEPEEEEVEEEQSSSSLFSGV